MKHEPFFTDSGELDHVLYLLAENVKELANFPLSDEEEAFHLANCPLVCLKKRLRDELIKSNIEPGEIEDANELFHLLDRPSLNEYQIACAEALITVYMIDSFSELAERLEELKGKLSRVQVTSADGAIFDADAASKEKATNASGERGKPFDDLISSILIKHKDKLQGRGTWKKVTKIINDEFKEAKAAKKQHPVIREITDTQIYIHNRGKPYAISGIKDHIHRIKTPSTTKNMK